jgi:hypothetical protein
VQPLRGLQIGVSAHLDAKFDTGPAASGTTFTGMVMLAFAAGGVRQEPGIDKTVRREARSVNPVREELSFMAQG